MKKGALIAASIISSLLLVLIFVSFYDRGPFVSASGPKALSDQERRLLWPRNGVSRTHGVAVVHQEVLSADAPSRGVSVMFVLVVVAGAAMSSLTLAFLYVALRCGVPISSFLPESVAVMCAKTPSSGEEAQRPYCTVESELEIQQKPIRKHRSPNPGPIRPPPKPAAKVLAEKYKSRNELVASRSPARTPSTPTTKQNLAAQAPLPKPAVVRSYSDDLSETPFVLNVLTDDADARRHARHGPAETI